MSTDKLQDLEVQFKVHETQCEERWKTIFARIEGVEARLDKMPVSYTHLTLPTILRV